MKSVNTRTRGMVPLAEQATMCNTGDMSTSAKKTSTPVKHSQKGASPSRASSAAAKKALASAAVMKSLPGAKNGVSKVTQEEATAFLQRAGILTASGKSLAFPYK